MSDTSACEHCKNFHAAIVEEVANRASMFHAGVTGDILQNWFRLAAGAIRKGRIIGALREDCDE